MDDKRSAVVQSGKKLFCLQLKLTTGNVEYQPSLDSDNADNGFMQIIIRLMNDICSLASQFDRIVQPVKSAPETTTNVSKCSYKSK